MASRRLSSLTLVLALALGCGDCGGGSGPPDSGDRDSAIGDTGASDARGDAGPPPACVDALPVDMIWLVDNSNSMAEEQASLAANFPALIEVLTQPPDADGDGEPDFPPLTDLRVAVVTPDLGVGDNPGVIGCGTDDGDEGLFITESRAPGGGCAGLVLDPPPWLQFDGTNAADFNDDFGCITQLGTDGCGLEQQLEAMHRSLFVHTGAGGPHEGFLRDNSLVAVVYVTDEDDCSAADETLFDPSPGAVSELGRFGTRCAFHPERLHPTSRYIDALRNLSLDRRGDVIVAAITGVPRDLTSDPTNIDYDALMDDPRMRFTIDPTDDNKLVPACSFGGVGSAPPARRIVEVVQDFADRGDGLVQSICAPDLRPSIEAIANLIAARICDAPI